jgi:phosphatidylserine/phosphatidylglycerophosphate/cardiolipin synthase-like enzyme
MKMLRFAFVICAAMLCGALIGYGLAGPVALRDFTIRYSLDEQKNDQALIGIVDGAERYVYFAIYEFTKEDIAMALLRAKKRGLIVRGLMDAGQSRDGAQARIVGELKDVGIPIEFQRHPKGIMHLKLLVTDTAYALGSYNWTESATMLNDEILEIGTAEPLRQEYLGVMQKVLAANQ